MTLNFLGKRKLPPSFDINQGELNEDRQAGQTKAGTPNPFVKIGDKIKIHSHSGPFIVDSISNGGFVVKHYSKRMNREKLIYCTWDDFRNWCKV